MLLLDYGCTGILTINSVSLNNVAWDITDLTELWHVVEQRGQDRVLPGAAGVIPYQRYETVTRLDLIILINGSVNQSGTPFSDPIVGLRTNINTLMTGVVNPPGSAGGTRAATLVDGTGSDSADLHVLGLRRNRMMLEPTQDEALWEGTLQLSIPEKFA
jgi:hypothetical protein